MLKNSFKTLFAVAVLIFTAFSCTTKDGIYKVEIYALNDVHGKFFDSLYVEGKANSHSLANVSEYLKNRRSQIGSDAVAMVDLGDALQGDNSVFYANYIDTATAQKHLFTRVAEYLGYDAMVVGNHDIEAGHPVYDKIMAETQIPYLAANAIDIKSGNSYFKPYAIFEKNGLEIAVIGMTNPNIKKWLGEELWSGMEFLPIDAMADSLVEEVHSKYSPDIVILAIHAGLGDGTSEDIENPARYLAANIKGIDILFSSHDHQTACEKIWNGKDSVLLMEGGSRVKYLIKVDAALKFNKGELVSKSFDGQLVPMDSIAVDKDYVNNFRADYLKTKSFTNQEIGILNNDIITTDAFFGPSAYINLIHSVQLAQSGADISMAAPLTYNGHIDAGKLIYHDLFTIYPFENQLYVLKLTGKQILDCLEYSYDTWINTMTSQSDHLMRIKFDSNRGNYSFVFPAYNFDSAAGIIYDVDVREPFGKRVKIKSMSDGTKFDLERTYSVAMSSYRANGGGDLLTKGAGIPKEQLPAIIINKMDDIRGMIFDFYRSGQQSNKMISAQWKFVPEPLVASAAKRDRALLFGESR